MSLCCLSPNCRNSAKVHSAVGMRTLLIDLYPCLWISELPLDGAVLLNMLTGILLGDSFSFSIIVMF